MWSLVEMHQEWEQWELDGECLGEPGAAEPAEWAGEGDLSGLLSSILPP